MRPDLTVGQRLALGFAAPLVLLAGFVVAVYSWNDRTQRQQEDLIEQLWPVSEATQDLERSILQASIALRDYLLTPDAAHLAGAQGQLADVRRTLGHFEGMAGAPADDPLLRPLRDGIEAYLHEGESLIESTGGHRPDAARLAALTGAREKALQQLGQLRRRQGIRFADVTAHMQHSRGLWYRQLLIAALITLLLVAAAGIWTTRSLRRPLDDLVAAAAGIEVSDWSPALRWSSEPPARNEIRRLARALGIAAVALQRRDRRVKADRKIADAAAGSLVAADIASQALAAVVEKMHAGLGVVYFSDRSATTLRPVATHAAGAVTAEIRVGEGLAGQAAQERRVLVMREIPRDTPFRVRLGYDEAPPRCVAAAPIVFRDHVLGVLLVGALHEFDDYSLGFLESAAAQLAAGLQNSLAHAELRRLADELRGQHQRVQSQADELQAQNEELQVQGEELQAQGEEIQVQNEELKRLTDQLTLADTRKNDFLALLAHELRNPLAAISNGVYVLLRARSDPVMAENMRQVIARQTRQLTRLIDDLLDISRIVRGTLQVERERLDFTALVRDSIEDLKPALDQAHMTIELSLPERSLWVTGDRARLAQVISNICGNSIKYRRDGAGALRVGLEAGPNQATLRIADDGIGIDPSFMPRIFESFSQASPRDGGNGLGLGLSVVKALVTAHGGSVEARSDGLGRGAEFIVRLPVPN
jgi:signal transduction histidine kinase/CHASE3 domain sensor protein